MKFTQTLIIGLLAVACGYSQSPSPQTKTPIFQFRTAGLGNITPFTGLLFDSNRKPASVATRYINLSEPYERQDAGPVVLYREVAPVPPETKPTKVPVVTAELGKAPLYLMVLIGSHPDPTATTTTTPSLTTCIVDDSWEAHPVDTVRVFNFSRRRVAVQIEDFTTELSTTESTVFPYPKNKGIIRLKVATLESAGWKLRSTTPQGIISGTRSNIFVEDFKPEIEDPNPEDINVFNLVDPLPPPPPPNQVVAGLRSR
jgi:hypothetical protein